MVPLEASWNCRRLVPFPLLVMMRWPLVESLTIKLVTPPDTVPKTRTAALLLLAFAVVLLLVMDIVPFPVIWNEPMLFVEVELLLIPTVLVVVFVNCAMAFEFGTTEDVAPFVSQLAAVNHAPPLPPRQTKVCCALALGTEIRSIEIKNSATMQRNGDFVFMGMSAERGWQQSVNSWQGLGVRKKVGEKLDVGS